MSGFSDLCFNQFIFLNVCISAGHMLWGVLAEFGTTVVPRIGFRSPVVVTGSPPSSNHYIRMQGKWWISLLMKMVRTSCRVWKPCLVSFFCCFLCIFKAIFHLFLFLNSQQNIQPLFCICNFCFFHVSCFKF